MFRPSRPMIRPFISSLGSATADDRGLGGVLGGDPLDRQGDDLPRVLVGRALGLLPDVAGQGLGLAPGLVLGALQHFPPRLLRR